MKAKADINSLAISSRQAFTLFSNNLLLDYQQSGSSWENKTLGDFLEAMAAYATDIDSFYQNMKADVNAGNASWRVFADILRDAKLFTNKTPKTLWGV